MFVGCKKIRCAARRGRDGRRFRRKLLQRTRMLSRLQEVQSAPLQCEISSSANPRVRGPQIPMDSITTSIEAAMKVNTPATPKSRRKKPIRKLVKMALNRLHEYTKPTAWARILVGKSSG